MKVILMALAAAGIIGSTTTLAETPVTPAEEEKIKAALEALGCTGRKIEKEDEGSTFSYEAARPPPQWTRIAALSRATIPQGHLSHAPRYRSWPIVSPRRTASRRDMSEI